MDSMSTFLFTNWSVLCPVCSSQEKWRSRWKWRNWKTSKLWTLNQVNVLHLVHCSDFSKNMKHRTNLELTNIHAAVDSPAGGAFRSLSVSLSVCVSVCVLQVCTLLISRISTKTKKSSNSFRRYNVTDWSHVLYWFIGHLYFFFCHNVSAFTYFMK